MVRVFCRFQNELAKLLLLLLLDVAFVSAALIALIATTLPSRDLPSGSANSD